MCPMSQSIVCGNCTQNAVFVWTAYALVNDAGGFCAVQISPLLLPIVTLYIHLFLDFVLIIELINKYLIQMRRFKCRYDMTKIMFSTAI